MPPSPVFKWDTSLGGTARVAGQTLSAAVYLHGGEPAVWVLDVIPTLQLSTLFDQLFSPISLAWPSDIFDLTLTDSSIFYSYVPGTKFPALPALPPAILAEQANVPGEGLFVATTISLSLAGQAFGTMSAYIRAFLGKGFIVEGELENPIDFLNLGILSITAADSTDRGPSLLVQSYDDPAGGTSRQFTLDCGYTLFGARFAESLMTVSTDSMGDPPKLAARLTYPTNEGPLGPWKNLELDFTWSSDAGFQIQNFPSISLHNLPIDFAHLLQKVSQTSCVKGLTNLVWRDGLNIQTNFKITPSLSSDGGSMAVVINGFYKLGADGNTVVKITLPQLSFSVPTDFHFNDIADWLGKNIANNAEVVVKALWDDKDSLALFLSVFMAKQALQAAISELAAGVCNDLFDYLQQVADQLPTKDNGGNGDGGGGGGCGGHSGVNVVTLITTWFKSVGKAIGSVGSRLSKLASGFGSLFGGDDDNHNDIPAVPPNMGEPCYLWPEQVSRTQTKPGRITMDWSAYLEIDSFDVQFFDSTNTLQWSTSLFSNGGPAKQEVFIPVDPPPLPPGLCVIKVRSNWSGFTDVPTSDWATASIRKLDAVSNVVANLDATGEVLIVQWDAVTYATEYQVAIRNLGGWPMVEEYVSRPGVAGSFTSTLSNVEAFQGLIPGTYVVSVRALVYGPHLYVPTQIPGDWTDAAGQFSRLIAPGSVTQTVIPGGLRVTWTSVGNQAQYRIRVVKVVDQTTTQTTPENEVLNLLIMGPRIGPGGLVEQDLSFDQFSERSRGQYVTKVIFLGDTTHMAGQRASSPSDVLFGGVGDMKIGSTFMVS